MDASDENVKNALTKSIGLNEAINLLMPDEIDLSGFKNTNDIIARFKANLQSTDKCYELEIHREDLWRNGLAFYKSCCGKVDRLTLPLQVRFIKEDGVDCVALKIEFFSKLFQYARDELF